MWLKSIALTIAAVSIVTVAQSSPVVVYDRKLSDRVTLACDLARQNEADVRAHMKPTEDRRIRVQSLVGLICGLKDQIKSPAKRD